MKTQDRVQVLIVGSGAGGSVTALELARSGMDVLVLEEGGRFDIKDYGAASPQAMERLYRRRGMTPILGPVSVGYVEGCCVGGTTEINSGFWQRTPREILLAWKSRYGLADAGADDLAPHFIEAEKLLHVGTHSGDWPASTRVFAKGVEAMGWSMEEIPRTAKNCVQSNTCASGCPTGAKQGMSRSIIPRAETAGAGIKPNCRVRSLLKKGSRIEGVIAEIENHEGAKERVRIDAEHVFVCGGATETPALLRRSGIKRNVGNTLSLHLMLKVVARFKHEIDAEHSVLPLLQVKEFWPEMTMGGAFYSTGHLALMLSDNWPETGRYMNWRRHMAAYYVAVRSDNKGYVRPSPLGDQSSLIYYRLTRRDLANLSRGLAKLCALLLAGGAVEAYPCVYGVPSIDSESQAARWLNELLPRKAINLTTVHAFCACPMGERRDLCAADSFGKVHGYENLYINDASMLPDSPGVNPQASIMAMARRNAIHFKEEHK